MVMDPPVAMCAAAALRGKVYHAKDDRGHLVRIDDRGPLARYLLLLYIG